MSDAFLKSYFAFFQWCKGVILGLSNADSNSRVQAIIDGQGIALWDRFIAYEINSGHLHYLSDIWLDKYGYYVRANDSSLESKVVQLFLNWLRDESKDVN